MTAPSQDPQAISDAIAASIRATIRKHGTTIQAVSDAAGIPYTTLQRKLSGSTSLTVTELLRIADAVGVDSPVGLIRESPTPPQHG